LKQYVRIRVSFYRRHPAIAAYTIGEQVALHIINDKKGDKDKRLKAWFSCLNQLGGVVREVEGKYHRPVATISGTTNREVIGHAKYGADEKSLSNVDFHMFNAFTGVQFNLWLNGQQRRLVSKPVVISGYGVDACAYNPGNKSCKEDEEAQAKNLISISRDIMAAYNEPTAKRLTGSFIFSYSDEWWRTAPYDKLCDQNDGGYDHAAFPDGYLNEEWFGLFRIQKGSSNIVARKAYNDLIKLWNGQDPWTSTTRKFSFTSHKTGDKINRVVFLSGTFQGFQKKAGESIYAKMFLLIRPFQSATHYPVLPFSLCCGNGPKTWNMLLYIGRGQDKNMKFEIIPAYTTSRKDYELMLKTEYFNSKPTGLHMMKDQSIFLTRNP